MKKYDCILVNGDSYSAKDYMFLCYSEFLQRKLHIPVYNVSATGSSNDRIFRTTIEHVLELKKKYNCILVINGLSFISRDEVWYDGNDVAAKEIPDLEKYPSSRLITSRALQGPWDKIKDYLVDININRQLTHFYTNLYMLINTLENLDVDYFIFSGANNVGWAEADWQFLNLLQVKQQCDNNPNIFKLHDFCIPFFAQENKLLASNTGHMYEDGHDKFSDFLIEFLKLDGQVAE